VTVYAQRLSGDGIPGSTWPLGVPQAGVESAQVGRLYPNPTQGPSAVRFSLARDGQVNVGIYDIQGRLMRTLASGVELAGDHLARWDGQDSQGVVAKPGVYFTRVAIEGRVTCSRFSVVR
jgi:hypothetical protein